MPKIIKGGVEYGSAPNSSTWEGTQAQYDAIVSPDPNVTYFITDGVVNPMPAKNVGYDNTLSGLSATTVQGAIDEIRCKTYYGVCSSSGAARTVTLINGNDFVLAEGVTIHIKFENSYRSNGCTLDVNNTGAVRVMAVTDSSGLLYAGQWLKGQICTLTYDGTYWLVNDGRLDGADINFDGGTSWVTSTSVQGAIKAVAGRTDSDGLHNITLESGFTVAEYMNYFKLGRLVVVNVGGLTHNATTLSALVCQGLPVMRSRALGVAANDTTTNKVTLLWGTVGTGTLKISAHEANVRYYGQITYLTD